jgi:hypothetical protein
VTVDAVAEQCAQDALLESRRGEFEWLMPFNATTSSANATLRHQDQTTASLLVKDYCKVVVHEIKKLHRAAGPSVVALPDDGSPSSPSSSAPVTPSSSSTSSSSLNNSTALPSAAISPT